MPILDSRTVLGVWPRSPVDLSVEALAGTMRARGATRAIAAHTTAIFYDPSAGNQAMEALARQHAALTPAAVLNPLRYPACLEEAARALAAGTTCFRFYPALHGYPFAGRVSALRELFGALRGARLLQVECGGAGLDEVAADLADLLPAPTALTVDSPCLGLALAAAAQAPNLLIETSALLATGAIEAAVRAVGAERVLFGSGAPLTSLGSAVLTVQYATVSEADRAAILAGNASRILAV